MHKGQVFRFILVAVFLSVSVRAANKNYDDDEGRPYEFGFTIDGEQHRHESRDVNGIIQGEFGFITGDGVYHTTVYATDENGSFKILSMRSVKVSPPLDQLDGPLKGGNFQSSKYQGNNSPGISTPQRLPSQQTSYKPNNQLITTNRPIFQTNNNNYNQPKPFGQQNTPIRQTIGQTFGQQNTPVRQTFGQQNTPGKQMTAQTFGQQQNNNAVFGQQTFASQKPSFFQQQASASTTKAPFLFTTKPTIKPACGGCGVPQPTTAKPQGLPFQTPEFQKKPNGLNSFAPPSNNLQPPSGPIGSISRPTRYPSIATQNDGQQNNNNAVFGSFNQNPSAIGQTGSTFGSTFGSSGPNYKPSFDAVNAPSPISAFHGQKPNAIGQTVSTFGNKIQTSNPGFSTQIKPSSFGTLNQPSPIGNRYNQNANTINGGTSGQRPSNNPSFVNNNFQNGRPNVNVNPGNSLRPSSRPSNPYSNINKVTVEKGVIKVPNQPAIPIVDKYPGMVDGLPAGVKEQNVLDLLYKFNYTVGFHGHHERGLKNGAKIGGYFVNGRDGFSRVVTYIADENGYQPKFKLINLGLDSADTPKLGTEKTFGLKNFEFVWYPVD